MSLNTSRKDVIAHRRENVSRLRLRGLSIREIITAMAKMEPPMLGKDGQPYNVATIHGDLKAITAEWRERAAADIATLKAEQLAELREVKRKAWGAGDLANLLRAIKQEAEIIGTPADKTVRVKSWQDDVIELIRQRKVTAADVAGEYGQTLAQELFAAAGVDVTDAA